jgi:hypothetical protein
LYSFKEQEGTWQQKKLELGECCVATKTTPASEGGFYKDKKERTAG